MVTHVTERSFGLFPREPLVLIIPRPIFAIIRWSTVNCKCFACFRGSPEANEAVFATYCPCVHGVPFGMFALASYILAFAEKTALAIYRLPVSAKRNGGGLIGRAEGGDLWVFRNGRRQRLTGYRTAQTLTKCAPPFRLATLRNRNRHALTTPDPLTAKR